MSPLTIPDLALPALPDDDRLWVPQAPNVWFRPLLLNTVNGEWVNLLRVTRSGVLSRHRHPAPVHGYVIRGSWRYLEHDWVARDYFRERFRSAEPLVNSHAYDHSQIGCLLLCTSRETMLADLVERGLDEGDSLANANTVIYMGRIREGEKFARGLVIAKHRGSACTDEVIRYRIGEKGLAVV